MNPEPPVQNELTEAWDAVTSKLISPVVQTAPICEVVSSALVLLGEHGLGQYLEGWLLETLQANLTTDVVPEFWTRLRQSESLLEERDRARALLEAFRCLLERLDPFLGGLERLGSWQDEGCGGLSGPGVRGLTERAFSVICALLLFTPPPVLQTRVLEFYSRTFSVHMSQKVTDLSSAEGDGSCLCPGCGAAPQLCWCQEALDHLQEFSQILSRLQLLELVSSDAVTSILHQLIEKRMEQRCRGEFETSFLMDFNEWLGQVLEWLRKVFASAVEEMVPSESATDEAPPSGLLRRWHCHMRQFFYRIYVSMRIEELFSIIRDFPESTPAIEDLKFCLDRTNQRPQLLASLKSAFETRLLHPGVHTSDIITVYISAIKALRELDPSMVILQVACQPIRKYLRTREDTVRQIVDSLTGDTEACSDLASELSRADPVALETQDSEDEETDPEEWTPDPTDALTDKTGSKRRSSDIITLLVSIYGSKEIFINEYKTVLADRLLHQLTYNTAREIRNVELLKLRFGESHMHYCEVMLKDVADSRRINTNIREEESRLPPDEQSTLPLSALIISSEFWPQLKEEKMELPAVVSKAMENYSQRFEKLKAMRTLKWNPQLGSVTLDVELEDRTISKLNVSPLHAAILLHFQERGQWSLEELSGVLGVPQELLLRKMSLWLQQGVLQEVSAGFYSVQETSSSRERADKNLVLMDHDEDSDSSTAIMSEQREEKLQLFWAYIQAMLTNLECMTLERIHTMLRMFVAAGPGVTEMDIGELQTFLQKKIRVHQLVVSAGVYRLPKASQ